MELFLSRLGAQALNMAIRSGIALTSTYAVSQCSRIMGKSDDSSQIAELGELQEHLQNKLNGLSPAIALIELKSQRGNSALESALPIVRGLQRSITSLGKRLEDTVSAIEDAHQYRRSRPSHDIVRRAIEDVRNLIARIDREIPTLHIAILSSGQSLSSSLSPSTSPSRLLQASRLLEAGDAGYLAEPTRHCQIGPEFTISLYMLFLGHAQWSHAPSSFYQKDGVAEPYALEDNLPRPLWQEVLHKARVRLYRTSPDHGTNKTELQGVEGLRQSRFRDPETSLTGSPRASTHDVFAYHLEIVEDLDDGRLHDHLDFACGSAKPDTCAFIRESVPIHQISRIFYADTGRLLNINHPVESENNPVLLLKRDVTSERPARLRRETSTSEAARCVSEEVSGLEADFQTSNEQRDIDKQLEGECYRADWPEGEQVCPTRMMSGRFPAHLDPEWIALEVFLPDHDGDTDEDSSGTDEGSRCEGTAGAVFSASELAEQVQHVSMQSSPCPGHLCSTTVDSPPPQNDEALHQSPAARQPSADKHSFGAIATSLSLLEMLIRLTSLQESQQAPLLSIPDYTLTFFLEESSTTGLIGEERLRARNEAKRRVGFDPFIDSPPRGAG